jgi:hypothetical protein
MANLIYKARAEKFKIIKFEMQSKSKMMEKESNVAGLEKSKGIVGQRG